MTSTSIATIQSRLPMPNGMSELDAGKWRVLCESVFPSARTPEAIMLALDYCKARNLDVMKKMVHIVPMWSSSQNREVETVWPSINEVQATASRTGKYAGMDEPKWGNDITRTFKGVKRGNVGDTEVTLTFPEWCAITVYRIVDGQRCAFTEPVYWLEAYARIGKTELPNDMWSKRTRGQIIKVAKAFSLRAAFPEEGSLTAEEMEGRVLEDIDGNGVVIDNTKPLKKGSPFKNAAVRGTFCDNVTKSFNDAKTPEELTEIMNLNKPRLDEMAESSNEHDHFSLDGLRNHFKICWNRLIIATRETPEDDTGTFDPEEAPAYIKEMDAQFREMSRNA